MGSIKYIHSPSARKSAERFLDQVFSHPIDYSDTLGSNLKLLLDGAIHLVQKEFIPNDAEFLDPGEEVEIRHISTEVVDKDKYLRGEEDDED